MNIVDKARGIALEAFEGIYRRDGKTPYFTHLQAVVNRVKSDEAKAVAWLHDILEDTRWTWEMLLQAEMPIGLVECVKLMTHDREEAYETYLRRIVSNPVVREVKIADMLSNLADQPTDKQIVKYARGLLILMGHEPS